MKRKASYSRKTKETEISVRLNLDGRGVVLARTPVTFLSHMIESLAQHGRFDLDLRAADCDEGDRHHLVEDCGLCLGAAFRRALGDFGGIRRAGHCLLPMDDALALAAVDLAGRPFLQFRAAFKRRFCGDFDTDLATDFFKAFADQLGANVALRILAGRSDHHKLEALFKALGRALGEACSREGRFPQDVCSTKGVIDYDQNS